MPVLHANLGAIADDGVSGVGHDADRGQPGEFIAGAARNQYRELWNSRNAKRGFSSDANPWVWPLSFHTAEKGA